MTEVHILTGNWSDYDCHDEWTVGVYESLDDACLRQRVLQEIADKITPSMARENTGHMRTLLSYDPDAKHHDDIKYLVETVRFFAK